MTRAVDRIKITDTVIRIQFSFLLEACFNTTVIPAFTVSTDIMAMHMNISNQSSC